MPYGSVNAENFMIAYSKMTPAQKANVDRFFRDMQRINASPDANKERAQYLARLRAMK
jgi:hypothetical protein